MIFASINKNELYRQAIHFRLSACATIIPHPSFLSISSSHFYHLYKFFSFQSCIFHKFTEPSQSRRRRDRGKLPGLPMAPPLGDSRRDPTARARPLPNSSDTADRYLPWRSGLPSACLLPLVIPAGPALPGRLRSAVSCPLAARLRPVAPTGGRGLGIAERASRSYGARRLPYQASSCRQRSGDCQRLPS